MSLTQQQLLQNLLERENKTPFTAKFEGDPLQTLQFISQIKQFLLVNGFTTPLVRFRRIFNTLPEAIRRSFLNKHTKETEMTIEKLCTWLLVQYPPAFDKRDFIVNLKAMEIRRNENPKGVWDRFMLKRKQMNEAIGLLNQGITAKAEKIKQLTEEQLIDALTGIFIRKNSRADLDNDGSINELTLEYIAKKNPKTLRDWTALFETIGDELVPRCTQTDDRYQFTTYPPDPLDFDIYSSKSKHQTATDSDDEYLTELYEEYDGQKAEEFRDDGKIAALKRPYFDVSKANGPPPKRQRRAAIGNLIVCRRCSRRGHHINDCRTNFDVFGQFIDDGNPFCHKCKQRGHLQSRCSALKRDFDNESLIERQQIDNREINTFQKGGDPKTPPNHPDAQKAITQSLAALVKNVQKDDKLTEAEKEAISDHLIAAGQAAKQCYARH